MDMAAVAPEAGGGDAMEVDAGAGTADPATAAPSPAEQAHNPNASVDADADAGAADADIMNPHVWARELLNAKTVLLQHRATAAEATAKAAAATAREAAAQDHYDTLLKMPSTATEEHRRLALLDLCAAETQLDADVHAKRRALQDAVAGVRQALPLEWVFAMHTSFTGDTKYYFGTCAAALLASCVRARLTMP